MTLYNIHPTITIALVKKISTRGGCNVVDYGDDDDGDGVIGNYSGGGGSSSGSSGGGGK